ncbi:MAG: aminotransferase class III-fold pyridoxal phosphate-dependent enzyme [Geopsychrobacter sp.]|nr:aminotransferase class III-fold pyridoxal phosphate-dependent enzyme [Geopsychrobacter sp.]
MCDNSFADMVFFANSGAEAVEACLKTARKYHAAQSHPEKYRFITFSGAFHGRTLATIAAAGNLDYLDGFGPPLEGFDQVSIDDMETVEQEITEETAKAVFDLLSCGVNVGNQAVLLKGINDDVETFRELHQKLLRVRIKPYYVFYCEPAPGIDHFRTPVEKGAELIRDALRGHTTGLAQPMYVIATNIGKIPLMPDYYITGKDEQSYYLRNHKGEKTSIPNMPG